MTGTHRHRLSVQTLHHAHAERERESEGERERERAREREREREACTHRAGMKFVSVATDAPTLIHFPQVACYHTHKKVTYQNLQL